MLYIIFKIYIIILDDYMIVKCSAKIKGYKKIPIEIVYNDFHKVLDNDIYYQSLLFREY